MNIVFSLILCLLGLLFYAGAMYDLLKEASAPAEGKKIAAAAEESFSGSQTSLAGEETR